MFGVGTDREETVLQYLGEYNELVRRSEIVLPRLVIQALVREEYLKQKKRPLRKGGMRHYPGEYDFTEAVDSDSEAVQSLLRNILGSHSEAWYEARQLRSTVKSITVAGKTMPLLNPLPQVEGVIEHTRCFMCASPPLATRFSSRAQTKKGMLEAIGDAHKAWVGAGMPNGFAGSHNEVLAKYTRESVVGVFFRTTGAQAVFDGASCDALMDLVEMRTALGGDTLPIFNVVDGTDSTLRMLAVSEAQVSHCRKVTS